VPQNGFGVEENIHVTNKAQLLKAAIQENLLKVR
jgi:hypothetical protein